MTEYKGYNVVPVRGFPMLQVKMKGQGPVPDSLKGKYTSRGEAHKAIDSHLASLLKGKRRNAKTKSSGTD